MNIYDKLQELNIVLPEPAPKGGIYKPVLQVDKLLYVSGQGPTLKGVPVIKGKLGGGCSLEEGQEAARMCTGNALSALQQYLGDLNKIKRVIKILGFVVSAEGFAMQPKVIDGASQMLADIFGEDGIGVRSAIGVSELPGNIAVEMEFIFEIK